LQEYEIEDDYFWTHMSQSTNPLVSVIIPVHNRPEELRRAIRSVIAQSYRPLEVLVMDDCSSDDLSFVLREFQELPIRHFRNNEKTNANVMRNNGLREATGDYVAFLDSDDEFIENHISSKLAELQESQSDGIFGSSFIDDGKSKKYAGSRDIMAGQTAIEYLLTIGFAPIPSWIVKRSCALEIGFDNTLHRHQDYDFFVRFADKYKWQTSWKPTIIIHWEAGVARQRHAGSEIQFIQRNFKSISPKVYYNYHLIQLCMYLEANAPQVVIDYYRAETTRYITQLSFIEFCTMYPQRKGATGFVINWLSFSSLILIRKFLKPPPPSIPGGLDS
jgi:glycosyltransferase involved in cell wall biosynthesis